MPQEAMSELARVTREMHAAYRSAKLAADRERAIRMSLLATHAWVGFFAGFTMLLTGAPFLFEDVFGIWIRSVLGIFGLLSGAVLAVGLFRQENGRMLEVAGLTLMGIWDLAIAAAIAVGIFQQGTVGQVFSPTTPIEATTPRPYAIIVYLGLAAMVLGVHLRAVLSDRRDQRA